MTTKEKIKALIVADKEIAQVIGAMTYLYECEDKQENASLLMLASNTIQEVIEALCDELPDQEVVENKND